MSLRENIELAKLVIEQEKVAAREAKLEKGTTRQKEELRLKQEEAEIKAFTEKTERVTGPFLQEVNEYLSGRGTVEIKAGFSSIIWDKIDKYTYDILYFSFNHNRPNQENIVDVHTSSSFKSFDTQDVDFQDNVSEYIAKGIASGETHRKPDLSPISRGDGSKYW